MNHDQEVLASLVLHVAPIGVPSLDAGHASIKQMLYLGNVWWYTLFTLQQLPVNYFLSEQVVGDAARPSWGEQPCRKQVSVKVQEKYMRSIKSLYCSRERQSVRKSEFNLPAMVQQQNGACTSVNVCVNDDGT